MTFKLLIFLTQMNFLKIYFSCNTTSYDVIIIVWKGNFPEITVNVTQKRRKLLLETFNLSHINFWDYIFFLQLFKSQYWNIVDIIIIFSSNKNKNCAFIWNLCGNSNRMIYNIIQFTVIQKNWYSCMTKLTRFDMSSIEQCELTKLVFLNSVWINDNKPTEYK